MLHYVHIFPILLEKLIEVFRDDFSVYGFSLNNCLYNLVNVFKMYEKVNLVPN